MRALSGFQTADGVERDGTRNLKRVPVLYGNMSRITAHMLKKGDKYLNNKIPVIGVNLESIQQDPEARRNQHFVESFTTTRTNPSNPKLIERMMGPPFTLNLSAAIYASSTVELFDIVEQILLVFNPRITIQVDVRAINADYLTDITLTAINSELQYPLGMDQQVVVYSLEFAIPVRLRYPANVDDHANIIQQIRWRIFEESEYSLLEEGWIIAILEELEENDKEVEGIELELTTS
jgi:hypothetical protein